MTQINNIVVQANIALSAGQSDEKAKAIIALQEYATAYKNKAQGYEYLAGAGKAITGFVCMAWACLSVGALFSFYAVTFPFGIMIDFGIAAMSNSAPPLAGLCFASAVTPFSVLDSDWTPANELKEKSKVITEFKDALDGVREPSLDGAKESKKVEEEIRNPGFTGGS